MEKWRNEKKKKEEERTWGDTPGFRFHLLIWNRRKTLLWRINAHPSLANPGYAHALLPRPINVNGQYCERSLYLFMRAFLFRSSVPLWNVILSSGRQPLSVPYSVASFTLLQQKLITITEGPHDQPRPHWSRVLPRRVYSVEQSTAACHLRPFQSNLIQATSKNRTL